MSNKITVTVLGTRGSMPVDDNSTRHFGGHTSCIRVDGFGGTVVLDAGTGLLQSGLSWPRHFDILITHPHLDHIQGLLNFSSLFDPEVEANIFGPVLEGRGIKEQLSCLMAPPLWPVGPEAYKARINWRDLGLPAVLELPSGVKVTAISGCHPGGSVCYRLDWPQGPSLVYAVDTEPEPTVSRQLSELATDCDLLIIDAHFTTAEYLEHKGWGHSSMQEAARLGTACGARRVLLTHHAPRRSDMDLWQYQRQLWQQYAQVNMAMEGMEIRL